MDEKQPIDKVIELLGGVVTASTKLGLKNYQTIQQWRKAGVPADYCPAIERATGGRVSCEALRPDIDWADRRYMPLADEPCANAHPPMDCAGCPHEGTCDDQRKGERRRLEKRITISRRAEDL